MYLGEHSDWDEREPHCSQGVRAHASASVPRQKAILVLTCMDGLITVLVTCTNPAYVIQPGLVLKISLVQAFLEARAIRLTPSTCQHGEPDPRSTICEEVGIVGSPTLTFPQLLELHY